MYGGHVGMGLVAVATGDARDGEAAALSFVLVVEFRAERLDLIDRGLGELREQLRFDGLDRGHQHGFDRPLGFGHEGLAHLHAILVRRRFSRSTPCRHPRRRSGRRSRDGRVEIVGDRFPLFHRDEIEDRLRDFEAPHREVAERLDLGEVDDALLVELEHREETHDHFDPVLDARDQRAETHRSGVVERDEERFARLRAR